MLISDNYYLEHILDKLHERGRYYLLTSAGLRRSNLISSALGLKMKPICRTFDAIPAAATIIGMAP